MGRIFGTDGVRGVAGTELSPELALRLGRAGAALLALDAPLDRPIVVGRDTRISGTMLEAAMIAGITSIGRDAISLGVIPTPGVACVVRRSGAAAGVMITASHNPIQDNGIKFFGADGFKLSDERERRIEEMLESAELPRPTHEGIGRARLRSDLIEHYRTSLREQRASLEGLTIVADTAFGAAYDLAPRMLAELGAIVVALHAEDDGARINVGCGATELSPLRERVRAVAAARPDARVVGVAFDGDADRALFVDERGEVVDGDRVLLLLARDRKRRGILHGDAVVGTVMSNMGLERALRAEGITLLRAAVGDRYVLEMMRERGAMLGGEQSGHLIDFERGTTGDGLMTAVGVFSVLAREGRSLAELTSGMSVVPQLLVNVRIERKELLSESEAVRGEIAAVERRLADRGRVLVRPSGTEPLVRIMLEGDDREEIERLAQHLVEVIRQAAERTNSPV